MQFAHLVARNSLIIFLMKKSNVFTLSFSWFSEHAQQSALKSLKSALSVMHLDEFAPSLLPGGAPLRKCL